MLVGGKMSKNVAILGENVTLICTVNSLVHTWKVRDLGILVSVGSDTPPNITEISGISISTRIVSADSRSISSSFSFLAVAEFNGTQIECKVGLGPVDSSQVARLLIFGEHRSTYPDRTPLSLNLGGQLFYTMIVSARSNYGNHYALVLCIEWKTPLLYV